MTRIGKFWWQPKTSKVIGTTPLQRHAYIVKRKGEGASAVTIAAELKVDVADVARTYDVTP